MTSLKKNRKCEVHTAPVDLKHGTLISSIYKMMTGKHSHSGVVRGHHILKRVRRKGALSRQIFNVVLSIPAHVNKYSYITYIYIYMYIYILILNIKKLL